MSVLLKLLETMRRIVSTKVYIDFSQKKGTSDVEVPLLIILPKLFALFYFISTIFFV